MKYCPNPRCRHRIAARSQAEYLDHIVRCAECGADLVAASGAFVEPPAPATTGASAAEGIDEDEAESRERQARMDVMSGIFGIAAGIAITGATYALALNGGIYMVAWGPMAFGLVRLLRGLEPPKKK